MNISYKSHQVYRNKVDLCIFQNLFINLFYNFPLFALIIVIWLCILFLSDQRSSSNGFQPQNLGPNFSAPSPALPGDLANSSASSTTGAPSNLPLYNLSGEHAHFFSRLPGTLKKIQ